MIVNSETDIGTLPSLARGRPKVTFGRLPTLPPSFGWNGSRPYPVAPAGPTTRRAGNSVRVTNPKRLGGPSP